MKKTVSFLLAFSLLLSMVVMPTAAAETSEVYYDSDVAGTWWDTSLGTSARWWPISCGSNGSVTAGVPIQGTDESDEDYATRYAAAEKTITLTAKDSSTFGSAGLYQDTLKADGNYTRPRNFKTTLRFKRTGDRGGAVQIWPTLFVASGAWLKAGSYVPSGATLADGYTDFINGLNDNDEVLYFSKGNYNTTYITNKVMYPIGVIGKTTDDKWHDIEYVYYIKEDDKDKGVRVRSLTVDGVVYEKMPTTQSKNTITQDDNTVLQTYCAYSYAMQNIYSLVYNESSTSSQILFYVPPKTDEGEAAGLMLSRLKYEGMTETYPLDVTGVTLGGSAANLTDGSANTMKADGKVVFSFDSQRPDAQVTLLKEGDSAAKAVTAVWDENDCVIDFASSPLTADSTYTLTVTSCGLSQSVNFTIPPESLDLTGVMLDGTAVTDYETGNTLKTEGKIALTFGEAKPGVTISLAAGTQTRVAPKGTWSGSTLTIDFANAPLRPNTTYTLTAAIGNESKAVTFTTGYDGYYVNDNFALYETGLSMTKDDATGVEVYPWNSYAPYTVSQTRKIVEDENGDKAIEIKVKSTVDAGSQRPYVCLEKTQLPQTADGKYADMRAAEVTFSFSEMDSQLILGVWTDAFYVQKDEDGKYYLNAVTEYNSAGVIDQKHKLCELTQGKHKVRFIYSCSDNNLQRKLYALTVDGQNVTTTLAGTNLSSTPIELNAFNTMSNIEISPYMTTGISGMDFKMFLFKNTGSEKAADASAKLYSVRYYPYTAEAADVAVSGVKAISDSGISVTVKAEDNKGNAHGETVMVASYNGDKLLDVKAVKIDTKPFETYSTTVTLSGDATSSVKMFRWSSAATLKPLTASSIVSDKTIEETQTLALTSVKKN